MPTIGNHTKQTTGQEADSPAPIASRGNGIQSLLSVTTFGKLFGVAQDVWDSVWSRLTCPEKKIAVYISMEIGADPDVFHPVRQYLRDNNITGDSDPFSNRCITAILHGPGKIPTYSGGLGVLAGDIIKSMAACRLPAAGITLLYQKGYFSQLVDARLGQIAQPTEWRPEETTLLTKLRHPCYPEKPLCIEAEFADENMRQVNGYAHVWMKLELNETLDYFVPVFFLDFNVPATPLWIREASSHLYDSSSDRIKSLQRRLLGTGSIALLDVLGLSSRCLHLNEQHGAIAIVHLVAEHLLQTIGVKARDTATEADILKASGEIARRFCYTIHTPVKAGHDRFPKSLYRSPKNSLCQKILDVLANDPLFPGLYNFTLMAMRVNNAVNSVSRLHRDVTRLQFPEQKKRIIAITNGVHHLTWISASRAKLFDATAVLNGWRQDPGVFSALAGLADDNQFQQAFVQAWRCDTERLVDHVNKMLLDHLRLMQEHWIDPPNFLSLVEPRQRNLSPDAFTIGFARRFSTYKRADLIFHNLDLLTAIIRDSNRPVQFLFAGKAHPHDEPGQVILKRLLALQEELYKKSGGLAKLIFIPDYDMNIAKMMVSGAHIWLNTPKRPLEASGTSGMKAAMNGVPNISILDGWWVEGFHDGATGWTFGHDNPMDAQSLSEDAGDLLYEEDAASFYALLPEVLRSFNDPSLRRSLFLRKAIRNLVINVPIFNTHRVVAEYADCYGLELDETTQSRLDGLKKLYSSDTKPRDKE